MLAQAGGWRLHQALRGITARRVVQQAMHSLRRLGDVLGGTLAPKDLVRIAAAAIDALAERAGGKIIAKPYYRRGDKGQAFLACQADSVPSNMALS